MDSTPSPPTASSPTHPGRRLRRRPASTLLDSHDDAPSLTAMVVDGIKNQELTSPPKPTLASHPQQVHSSGGPSFNEALVTSPTPVNPPVPRPRRRAQGDASEAEAEVRRRRKPRQPAVGGDKVADPTETSRVRRRPVNVERIKKTVPDEDGAIGRKRRRRNETSVLETENARLEQQVLCCSIPPTGPSSNDSQSCTGGVWDLVHELVMWKDVAKSSFWFGIGSTCFLSSCFSNNFSFNLIPALSNIGLIALALAFFRKAIFKSDRQTWKRFKLKEEDLNRTVRLVLPAANAVISMAQDLFSGEPGMTLKVAPVLLITAEYGHLVTPWRFSAIGFFTSFTVPKLFTCLSQQFLKHVDDLKERISGAWQASSHKRSIAFVGAMMSWNMLSTKTRIFSAFMVLVVLCNRYQRYRNEDPESSETENQLDCPRLNSGPVLKYRRQELAQGTMIRKQLKGKTKN